MQKLAKHFVERHELSHHAAGRIGDDVADRRRVRAVKMEFPKTQITADNKPPDIVVSGADLPADA